MRYGCLLAAALPGCALGFAPDAVAAPDGAVAIGAPFDAADVGSADGSPDGGPSEAPRGELLADDLCPGTAVAISSTGELAAYVSCAGRDPALAVRSIFGGDVFDLGPADPTGTIELSPDDAYVVYRSGGAVLVRHVLGVSPPSAIAEIEPVWMRFVRRPTEWWVLALTSRGSYHALLAYREGTSPAFATRVVVVEGSDLDPNRVLVDEASGQVVCGLGSVYARLSIEGGALERLAFAPAEGRILPEGLSSTHALVREETSLSYRSLTRGSERIELIAGLSGGEIGIVTHRSTAWIAAQGRISRVPLVWPTAAESVRSVEAVGLRFTPSFDRLLYATSTSVESTTTSGSSATLLVDRAPRMPFAPEISPTGRQIALVLDDGALVVAPLDAPGSAREVQATPIAGTVHYDGLGDRILLLAASDDRGRADVLRGTGAFAGEPYTMAWDVEGYWPVPGSTDVLYARRTAERTELRLLSERGGR